MRTRVRVMFIRLLVMFLFSLSAGVALFPTSVAASADSNMGAYSVQTTSPIHIVDPRVGSLWTKTPRLTESPPQAYGTTNLIPLCTLSHVGSGVWITAKHCLQNIPVEDLLVQGRDEKFHKIDSSWGAEEFIDIAAVFSPEAADYPSFEIAKEGLEAGGVYRLSGYGSDFSYLNTVSIQVLSGVERIPGEPGFSKHLWKSRSLTGNHRSCYGDSGAPIYRDNQLFAVHTAGAIHGCIPGHPVDMYHTEIAPIYQELPLVNRKATSSTGLSSSSFGGS